MTAHRLHTAAVVLCVAAAAAIVAGPPTAPLAVRWAGLALAIPAVILFILTAPRNQGG